MWIARACLNFPSADQLCVPLLGVLLFCLNSLLLVVPHLGLLSVTCKAYLGSGPWGNWLRGCGRHPTFCMSQAIRRDQVCLSSNKGGCFISHPLFAIYKPDPFGLTANLRPPPSRSLSMSRIVQLSHSQSSNDSSGAATSSGGENLFAFSWTFVYVFEYPNFIWELVNLSFCRGNRLSEGIKFVYCKKRVWYKISSFFAHSFMTWTAPFHVWVKACSVTVIILWSADHHHDLWFAGNDPIILVTDVWLWLNRSCSALFI